MTVTAEQAAEDFESLLGRAELGETITIERAGRPVVQLSPAPAQPATIRTRIFGRLEGHGVIPHDIKDPYEDEMKKQGWTTGTPSSVNDRGEGSRPVRLGSLTGKISIPDNWKEIAREEIEREFNGE